MAIIDSIQAIGFFKSNAYLVNVCLFRCHQHEHGRHFGIRFWGLMPCQQYFRYIKVTYLSKKCTSCTIIWGLGRFALVDCIPEGCCCVVVFFRNNLNSVW